MLTEKAKAYLCIHGHFYQPPPIEYMHVACDVPLGDDFANNLANVRSWRSCLSGDEVYRGILTRRRPIAAPALRHAV